MVVTDAQLQLLADALRLAYELNLAGETLDGSACRAAFVTAHAIARGIGFDVSLLEAIEYANEGASLDSLKAWLAEGGAP